MWYSLFLLSVMWNFVENSNVTYLRPKKINSVIPISPLILSNEPSDYPTIYPSPEPIYSLLPSISISSSPIIQSTILPTENPSHKPSFVSTTISPSKFHSSQPSSHPSSQPKSSPSVKPSSLPVCYPSKQPQSNPFFTPTDQPIHNPTLNPLSKPSAFPTYQPSSNPTFLVTQSGSIGTDWWYVVTANCSVIVNKVVHSGEQINDPVTYAFSFALTDSLPDQDRSNVKVSSTYLKKAIDNSLSPNQFVFFYQVTSWSNDHNIAKNVLEAFESLKTSPILIITPLHEKDIREATDIVLTNIKISTSSIPPPVIIPSNNSNNKSINWDLILIILVIVSIIIIILQLCSDNIKKTKIYKNVRMAIRLTYQRFYSFYKIICMFMSSLHTACIQTYNRGFSLSSQLDDEEYHLDDFSYHSNHLEINHSKHRNDYLEDDDDETLSEIMISPPSSPLIGGLNHKNNNGHYSKLVNSSIHNFKNVFDVIQDDDL